MRRVDPIAAAVDASSILKAAWQPPCLDYSPEYIRFQCAFPTGLQPLSIVAFDGNTPSAFIAATGRSGNSGEFYLSSFLAVRPGSDPALSIALVRHENELVRQTGRPLLLFTAAGSAGETLVKCRHKRGWKGTRIGQYRVHATVPQPRDSSFRAEEISKERWAVEANKLHDESLLAPSFGAADLEHFASDPSGRRFLAVFDEGGRAVATGMQAFTSSVTATGITKLPTLHYIRLAEQNPEILRVLLVAARHANASVVTVPNTIRISEDVAKSVGLRGTPALFSAYYFCPPDQEMNFRGTEFEIV